VKRFKTTSVVDQRSPERRARDEEIAAEPQLPTPELARDTSPSPVESHLARKSRGPVAVIGVVENGVARPLDPNVKLPEHARVIIVASEAP
jgi:hypothetical protein